MFCSNCGAEGSGNFCSSCGQRLAPEKPNPSLEAASSLAEEVFASTANNWHDEIRYEILFGNPEVRELISRYAAQAKKKFSAEDFLALCDKVIYKPMIGVSLNSVAKMLVPYYSRMGINTSKEKNELLAAPTGLVIVAGICAMAHGGKTIKQITPAEDGCLIESNLPSDMWSFEGELVISFRRLPNGTQIAAATKIRGQLYDWGKSKQQLEQLFGDIKEICAQQVSTFFRRAA
ncbi:hypothetical protein KIH39_00700 [Telmatocola sphagniphila]|uniref:Uncharacterized protein n=1 Tax=Telmatocola sphagniphila TaxID=1123043 RepID=A0A8E6EYA0_9BACT|nr:hypothetical protein [Telmatocola sphagniphila]QVL32468.1 hypothetical protein KIH39_00700 [Telmatocola sphagniphila]